MRFLPEASCSYSAYEARCTIRRKNQMPYFSALSKSAVLKLKNVSSIISLNTAIALLGIHLYIDYNDVPVYEVLEGKHD